MLAELRKVLPEAPVIYAADIAGLPYGAKTEAEIAARVAGLLGVLTERYRPRLATIACNTASTIALGMVRDVLNIPIVGTVPAIKPAAALTRSGTIGLLGTEATIRQAYVDRLASEFAAGKRLLRHAAPALVSAAEDRLRGIPVNSAAIRNAVEGLRRQPGGEHIDTVVLACTHFPVLADELAEGFGPGVQFVDGASGIARRIAHLTDGQTFLRRHPDFAVATGPQENRARLAPRLTRFGLASVEPI